MLAVRTPWLPSEGHPTSPRWRWRDSRSSPTRDLQWQRLIVVQCLSVDQELPEKQPIPRGKERSKPWNLIQRWSHNKKLQNGTTELDRVSKVAVFGGGSFGTAMGTTLARQKGSLKVQMLLRDAALVKDINIKHLNTKYLPEFVLPDNIEATIDPRAAIEGAQYIVHAIPVQHSRKFLQQVKGYIPRSVPIISVSKGMETETGLMMSEIIRSTIGKRHPLVMLSGPSFAKEVMEEKLTSLVAASAKKDLCQKVQDLFACEKIRVNTTTDVIGVEVGGASKNVLAIAAGIVIGFDLGHNAMAGLLTQGGREIRWLARKMGSREETVAGLSGMGDLMLTCYGDLSRNRTVGVRLAKGEKIDDILASMTQVAEGVTTAPVLVELAQKHRVKMPVMMAVEQVVSGNLSPERAVRDIMSLPQIEEK